MAITLAPAALDRVKGYLAAEPSALGLRFGVRRTGCSGWGYAVDLARAAEPGDKVFEQDGVRIFVDADSLPLVAGTEMDFQKQGLSEQCTFLDQPAATACGSAEGVTTEAGKVASAAPADWSGRSRGTWRGPTRDPRRTAKQQLANRTRRLL